MPYIFNYILNFLLTLFFIIYKFKQKICSALSMMSIRVLPLQKQSIVPETRMASFHTTSSFFCIDFNNLEVVVMKKDAGLNLHVVIH